MVTLHFYQDTDTDNQRIAHYQLTNPSFTATPQQALAQASTDPDRLPVLALQDNELVGFFVLVKSAGVNEVGADPRTAILIRSLSVSEAHRHQGVATQMMTVLPDFVRQAFPEVKELTLSVDHGNVAAQKLYAKLNYLDTGRRRYGRYGEQYVLAYRL